VLCRERDAGEASGNAACHGIHQASTGEPAAKPTMGLHGCRFFVHNALESSSAVRLHSDYAPCDWAHDKYSHQLWLERALLNSPWKTADSLAADVIFLAGHDLALWCAGEVQAARKKEERAGRGERRNKFRELSCPGRKQPAAQDRPRAYGFDGVSEFISGRKRTYMRPYGVEQSQSARLAILRKLLNDSSGSLGRPRVLAMPNQECSRARTFPFGRPDDLVLLVDAAHHSDHKRDIIVPFVTFTPAWFTEYGAERLALPAWSERKLLFFAGHVPQLFVSRTRYLLWRQLRRSEHVTTFSHTIGCSIGVRDPTRSQSSQLMVLLHARCFSPTPGLC
jgi:hypothetical protein